MADPHGCSAGYHDRIAIAVECHGPAEGRVDEPRIAFQTACPLAVERPCTNQTLREAGRIRGAPGCVRLGIVDIDLVDAVSSDVDGSQLAWIERYDRLRLQALPGGHPLLEQQAVLVSRGSDSNPEAPFVGEFARRDLEVCLRPERALATEDLVGWYGRAKQQAFRYDVERVPLGIALATPHAGEHRVIDAVVVPPAADRGIPPVAFVETVLRSHSDRLEGERLVRHELRHCVVADVKQLAVRPENQLFAQWRRVH